MFDKCIDPTAHLPSNLATYIDFTLSHADLNQHTGEVVKRSRMRNQARSALNVQVKWLSIRDGLLVRRQAPKYTSAISAFVQAFEAEGQT